MQTIFNISGEFEHVIWQKQKYNFLVCLLFLVGGFIETTVKEKSAPKHLAGNGIPLVYNDRKCYNDQKGKKRAPTMGNKN